MQSTMHAYEVRPRKDNGVDLISDALPFGRLWYDGPNAASNAIGYAQHYKPIRGCCDSRLRCSRPRDRDARARGRVQRATRWKRLTDFPRLQCANDVESRLVLKFLKVHPKSSFRNHGAGRFSSSLLINSGTLIGLARTGCP